MRRLKEAEEEANALRKQLAEAKEKAQVNALQVLHETTRIQEMFATNGLACPTLMQESEGTSGIFVT